MSFFDSGPHLGQLKANLSLACNRLKLLQKKKTEISEKTRAEIAGFIKENKIERARIRCEHIIREDYMVEVYDTLELLCEVLVTRFGLIQSQKEVDKGLEETIATIIWAGPRLQCEVAEFKIIIEQFSRKYGKKFVEECLADSKLLVKRDVMRKLKVEAIPTNLIEMYLCEIAKSFNVSFTPDPSKMACQYPNPIEEDISFIPNDDNDLNGFNKILTPLPVMPVPYPTQMPNNNLDSINSNDYEYDIGILPPGPPPAYKEKNSVKAIISDELEEPRDPPGTSASIFPDLPEVPSVKSSATNPSAPEEDVDFDELAKRFDQLKKK